MTAKAHLLTRSLRESAAGEAMAAVLAAALAAVDPAAAVARHLRRAGATLLAGGQALDLAATGKVIVVGAGKAGAPMARATAAILGDRLSGGLVVTKDGHLEAQDAGPGAPHEPAARDGSAELSAPPGRAHSIRIVEAGHPIPDQRGAAAAGAMATLLGGLGPTDLVIALISGGGSALLTMPAPGVSLGDIQALTGALLSCGASIGEINTLRKHLDGVKGGGLARLAYPATLVTLILSDVVGSPLDIIASGPTVADPGTFAEAMGVLARYGLTERAPPAVVAHLRRGLAGELAETPKAGDPIFARVSNLLVGDNRQAAAAALGAAQREGLGAMLLTTALEGEAREAGRFLAAILREAAGGEGTLRRPICIIAGGETTVTLRGQGRGGRNQELALAAVAGLAGLDQVALVALATDGGDGPTDAAGAVVTGTTLARARALGLDPADHLARNDAYPFFAALDDLLRPGPTGTNVNDLTFLFAW